LHARFFLCSDLKPANALVDEESRLIKLADLGLLSRLNTNLPGGIGTFGWRPPEMQVDCVSTEKVDVFPLGWVVAQMLTGSDSNGNPLEVWSTLSALVGSDVSKLIERACGKDPRDRLSPRQMLHAVQALRQAPGMTFLDIVDREVGLAPGLHSRDCFSSAEAALANIAQSSALASYRTPWKSDQRYLPGQESRQQFHVMPPAIPVPAAALAPKPAVLLPVPKPKKSRLGRQRSIILDDDSSEDGPHAHDVPLPAAGPPPSAVLSHEEDIIEINTEDELADQEGSQREFEHQEEADEDLVPELRPYGILIPDPPTRRGRFKKPSVVAEKPETDFTVLENVEDLDKLKNKRKKAAKSKQTKKESGDKPSVTEPAKENPVDILNTLLPLNDQALQVADMYETFQLLQHPKFPHFVALEGERLAAVPEYDGASVKNREDRGKMFAAIEVLQYMRLFVIWRALEFVDGETLSIQNRNLSAALKLACMSDFWGNGGAYAMLVYVAGLPPKTDRRRQMPRLPSLSSTRRPISTVS
jgi:serine/threonine protein kinase